MGPSTSARMSSRNPDLQVRVDAEDVAVEGGVMDLAHREAVRHNRVSIRKAVRNDVRGVEKVHMS